MNSNRLTRKGIYAAAALAALGMWRGATADAQTLTLANFDNGAAQGWNVFYNADPVNGPYAQWTNYSSSPFQGSVGPTPGSMAVLAAGTFNGGVTPLAAFNPNPAIVNPTNINSYKKLQVDVYVPDFYASPTLGLNFRFAVGEPYVEFDAGTQVANLAIRNGWQTLQWDISAANLPTAGVGYCNMLMFPDQGPMETRAYLDEFLFDNIRLWDFVYTPKVTTWNTTINNSQWGASGSWTNGIPGAEPFGGDTANFGTIITSNRNVNVSAGFPVGSIIFNNAFSYNLQGTGSITIRSPFPPDPTGRIEVMQGAHTIAVPLTIESDTTFSVASGSRLNVTGTFTAGLTRAVRKEGAGSVTLSNLYVQGFDIQEGTVRISAKATPNDPSGTSHAWWRYIGETGVLDLTNNSMIMNYATGTGPSLTEENNVRMELAAGRIISSVAGTPAGTKLGYADNGVLGRTEFAGVAVDADSILIKFTYAGDANLDGQVTISDLGDLASNWQSTTAVWRQGDFNYDGAVTISDLGDLASSWQAGVGSPLGMSFEQALAAVGLGNVVVPEPVSAAVLSLGLMGLAARRRRVM